MLGAPPREARDRGLRGRGARRRAFGVRVGANALRERAVGVDDRAEVRAADGRLPQLFPQREQRRQRRRPDGEPQTEMLGVGHARAGAGPSAGGVRGAGR
jgi:hypothetical protein